MVKKSSAVSDGSKLDPIIMDKILVSDNGEASLHIVADLTRVANDRQLYTDALCYTRGIPFDFELIQGSDPIALYIASEQPQMLKLNPNAAVLRARQYYSKHLQDIGQQAMMLALVTNSDNNPVLDVDPKPYTDMEDQKLPGLLHIPEPTRHLEDPVERRLRNFYSVLESYPELMQQFYNEFNRAMAALALHAKELSSTDEQGFRPSTAN